MAKKTIFIGTSPNDGTGDALRVAFDKINQNFSELYGVDGIANNIHEDTSPQLGGNLDVVNYNIFTSTTNADINITADGTGKIKLNSSTDVNGDFTITNNATINGSLQLANGPYITGVSTDPAMGGPDPYNNPEDGSDNLIPTQKATRMYLANLLQNAYIISVTTDNGILNLYDGDPFTLNGTGGILTAADDSSKNLTVGIDNNIIVTRTDAQTLTNKTLTAPSITDPSITGTSTFDNIIVSGNTISTTTDTDLILSPQGTGKIIIGSTVVNGDVVTTVGDTVITLAESVGVTGDLTVTGGLTATGVNNLGSQIISGNLNVKGHVYADDIQSQDSNADLSIGSQGTGVVNITSSMTTVDQTVNGAVTVNGQFNTGNININSNAITSTNTNGGITISPNGSGTIILNGDVVGVTNTLSANVIETTAIAASSIVADNFLTGIKTSTIVSNVLTLDFNYGTHIVSHNANINSITFSNANATKSGQVTVILTQDAGGGKTITGAYLTAGGLGLDISTAANAVNIVTFLTRDGSTFYGFSNGKNFS